MDSITRCGRLSGRGSGMVIACGSLWWRVQEEGGGRD